MRARYQKSKPYRANFTASEREAMSKEIRRQIVEMDRKHSDDLDAMVLYTLHAKFGFGKKRLRQFYEAMLEEHDKLIKHYEMPDEYPWLCKYKLKEIGVDIEQWNDTILPKSK